MGSFDTTNHIFYEWVVQIKNKTELLRLVSSHVIMTLLNGRTLLHNHKLQPLNLALRKE